MEISEMFYEMSKPNNEKYIIVFRYFCSFIGLRFNLKKMFQQKDGVDRYNVFLVWKREALEDNQAGRSTLFINSQYWVASNLSLFILQKGFQLAERNFYRDVKATCSIYVYVI